MTTKRNAQIHVRRVAATVLIVAGIGAFTAQAEHLEHLRVTSLSNGPGDASRVWAATQGPAPDYRTIAAGDVRVAGEWYPAWWPQPMDPPTILDNLGFGGRVRTVLVNGGTNIRGAGLVENGAGITLPAFWNAWNALLVLPSLPGGGAVRHMILIPSTGEYLLCGWTENGSGQRFAAFWAGDPIGGFPVFNVLPPLANQDSLANEILRMPGGVVRLVGWSQNPSGDQRAVHWEPPGAWATTQLANLPSGLTADATTGLSVPGTLNAIAGGSDEGAGVFHPVIWPQGGVVGPLALGLDATFDAGHVLTLTYVDNILFAFGVADDAADVESAFGWKVEAGTPYVIGDLNSLVYTKDPPRLMRVLESLVRPDPWGDTIVLAGQAEVFGGEWQAFIAEEVGLGDLNCDGDLNFRDINPFIQALTDPVGYAAKYPDCEILRADTNGDDFIGFDDINGFIDLLLAP